MSEEQAYLDHGLTGTTRARPGLDQALAAVRADDTLVVSKLGRNSTGWPGPSRTPVTSATLAERGIKLSLGGQSYDPTDPMDKIFFTILATFAEFEVGSSGPF